MNSNDKNHSDPRILMVIAISAMLLGSVSACSSPQGIWGNKEKTCEFYGNCKKTVDSNWFWGKPKKVGGSDWFWK